MNAHILIPKLKIHAHHGVMPQERIVGGDFYVTLDLAISVTDDALLRDELGGTANYDAVCSTVAHEMKTPCHLLEHMAYKIVRKIFMDFPSVHQVDILLEKENPPTSVPCKNIGVRIVLERTDVFS